MTTTSKPIANTYSEQIELIDPAKPIRLYRNLHTGLFSVKQGTVKFHTKNLFLRDVTFIVSEKLRQRVLREKKKNVHSFVQGYLCDHLTYVKLATGRWFTSIYVRYNPYEGPHFTTINGGESVAIASAIACMFSKEADKLKVYAKGIKFIEIEQTDLDAITDCDMIRESVAQHLL